MSMRFFLRTFTPTMSLGHNLKNILATIVLIAAIGLTAPVQAKVLAQYWTPDEFFAIDETNCPPLL